MPSIFIAKNILIILVSFLIGLAGTFTYFYFQSSKSPPLTQSSTTPQPSLEPTFALVPPRQAQSGILSQVLGQVEKLSRDSGEYAIASSGAQILTGESISTKEKSTALATISNFIAAHLNSNSELTFANLYPTDMVLIQKNGLIKYELANQPYPVAIRALHSLISFSPGIATIDIVDTDVSIKIASGSATLALVDNENATKIWKLNAGDRANIDDVARKVYLIQSR